MHALDRVVDEIGKVRTATAIDTDGCIMTFIQIRNNGHWQNPCVYLAVTNTDRRLPDKMMELWGYGKVHNFKNSPSTLGKKPQYRWFVSRRLQVKDILESCLSYFIIKKEQAEIALEIIRIAGDPDFRRVHNYSEAEIGAITTLVDKMKVLKHGDS